MKRLLLTSVFRDVAQELEILLSSIKPQELTVVFIPTAADLHDNKWFVTADREKLVEAGFNIVDLSLKGKTKPEVETVLNTADVIFVAGGNTFYLLQEARASGFTELVPTLVENGKVYVGSSAGSYLACPTIEVANWKHQDRNVVELKDLTALNLVPFVMSVHYKPEYAESVRKGASETKYPVRILTNEQALVVEGKSVRLVGQGPEIILENL